MFLSFSLLPHLFTLSLHFVQNQMEKKDENSILVYILQVKMYEHFDRHHSPVQTLHQ